MTTVPHIHLGAHTCIHGRDRECQVIEFREVQMAKEPSIAALIV